MKNNILNKSVSVLLVVLMILSVLVSAGLYLGTATPVFASDSGEISWTFANGEIAPFELVSGSPDGVSMTAPEVSAIYELHSPVFTLTDGAIDFLIGGSSSENTYVALCDTDGTELMRASGMGSAEMTLTTWDLSQGSIVGLPVYVKVVDNSATDYITFDAFHASGIIDEETETPDSEETVDPDTIHWNFEDGALAPFRVVDGEFGAGIIASWNANRNNANVPINKEGNYYLSTVETDTSISFNEAYVGEIVSPDFYITSPTMTMKIGGGALTHHTEDELYVAIVRASDDEVLVKYTQPEMAEYTLGGKVYNSGHLFNDVTITIPSDKYVEGERVYIKLVDNATETWAFISADDIKVKGKLVNPTKMYAPEMEIPDTYSDIAWSFEDGTIAPFSIASGATLNSVMITDLSYNWNSKAAGTTLTGKEIGKVGTYWLNTYFNTYPTITEENGKSTGYSGGAGSEKLTGNLISVPFVLDPENTAITMQLGGNVANSVSVYDYKTGEKVGQAKTAKGSWIMSTVSVVWNEGFTYEEGQILYMQIEDATTSSYGFVCVDNICFSGAVVEKFKQTVWSFEDGTIAPFTVTEGSDFNSVMITDLSYDWEARRSGTTLTGREIGKLGTYWLNTYFNASPVINEADGVSTGYSGGTGKETHYGILKSIPFVLNPKNTTITMQLGGNPANCVAVYDYVTGEQVGKAISAAKSWKMTTQTVEWNEGFTYTDGQVLYMQIEDVEGVTGWGMVCVDNISFSGCELEYQYADTIWSFENGTTLPFTAETPENLNKVMITDLSYDWNRKAAGKTLTGYEIGKHGKYWLNTFFNTTPVIKESNGVSTGYSGGSGSEAHYGVLKSVPFLLNPENMTITMQLGGNPSNCVAVYDYVTGEQVGKAVSAAKSWKMTTCTVEWNADFTYTEGQILYMQIEDVEGVTSWGMVCVDDIRGSFAFPKELTLNTVEQVENATGWKEENFTSLSDLVNANIEKYTEEEYPSGAAYLDALASMRTREEDMARRGISENSPEIAEWISEMEALAKEIQISTPVFGDGLIIFTVHNQYVKDHHNTHTMFPAYNGETGGKSLYTPGGAVRVLNLKTGEVTTLLEDSDGLFRDLEVSYDSNKILLSYRESRDSTYNIVEYTLSDDRLSVTGTKQLTSLSTADDMDPLYMPSGNIVFSSTRDPKYVMCHKRISANIYRMEADGANIVKITNSTLFERPTDVLPDGRIIYDRWEYNDRDFGSAQGLWTVYEDGTKQDTYYGNNSPTGATIEAKAIPGTNKVIATLSSCHDRSWGAIAIIDRTNGGVDGKAPVEMTWPQSVKDKIAEPGDKLNIDAYLNLNIKYEDPEPLSENQFLVSRMLSGSEKMGIYLIDTYGNETLLYEDATKMSAFDARVIMPREKEIATSERRNYKDEVGTFFVQDVYQGTHMEGVERGTVKSLRIVESMAKEFVASGNSYGGQGSQLPAVNWHSLEAKRVIGEVPVYEDGSAYFEVPQDAFVYFQLLDEDGRMIQSMRTGTLVQSGEQTGCVGCHEDRRTAPSTSTGRNTPMALEANVEVVPNPDYVEGSDMPKTIAVNTPDVPKRRIVDFETGTEILVDYNDPTYFAEYTDLPTMNFLTEVQPIFTNNCLACHGYDTPAASLSLVPDKDIIFNAAYINLWQDRNKSGVPHENLVGAVGAGDTTFYSAKTWGSYVSPLIAKIFEDESHASLLTDAEKRRIAEWVDLNGTYYGDYSSNYTFNAGGRSPLTAAERTAIGDTRTIDYRKITSLIYFDNPEKSPILSGLTGEEYDNALAIIKSGLERLRTNPDVDWRGLDVVPGNPALKINPYAYNDMDAWRVERVGLYNAMEAANRAAILNGTKLYDSDHESALASHNAKWPGWPTASKPLNAYTNLPE
ncbi:MAG: hypothetical protein IJ002_08535 [Clostridia bacterium]|nr:hypothetical protein [Clostridia bacterium]